MSTGASKVRTVLRNTAWTSVDLAFDMLSPMVTSVLVARVMGPTRLGAYAYVLWVAGMAVALGTLGIPTAVSRYVPDYLARRRPELAWAVVREAFRLQVLTMGGVVVAGLLLVFGAASADARVYASLAVLSIFPAGLLGIATAVNSSFEDVRSNVVPSVSGILTNVSGVVASLVFGWGLVGLAGALLAGRCVDAGLRFGLMSRNLPGHLARRDFSLVEIRRDEALPPALRSELLAFCGQSTTLLLLQLVVWNRSEMFFLKRFCDLREIAFFSLAFAFGLVPQHLAGPFVKAATTTLFAEQGRGAEWMRRFAESMWRYSSLLVWPAAVGLAAVGGPLLRVLYGVKYADALPAFVLAAALSGLPRLAEAPTRLVTVLGGQGTLVRWGLASACVTLCLDLWLVPRYCALGGSAANGLGQTVATIGVCAIAVRRFGFRLRWGFNLRVVAASAVMGLAVIALTSRLPDVVALLAGPIAGVVVYALAVRALGVLDADDAERLRSLEPAAPAWARPAFRWALAVCLPRTLGATPRS